MLTGEYLSANDPDTQVPFIAWPIDPPTIRQARWWWRVHLVAPGMREDDLYWLAQGFVVRELARDVLGVVVKFDDLEAHLAYRPWEDSSRLSAYMDAVDNGLIPRRHKYGFSYDQLKIIYRTESWDDDYSLMLDSGDTDYILSPSQSLRLQVTDSID